MDEGAWWAAVHGVAQSWTRLKQLSSSSKGASQVVLMVKNPPANAGYLRCAFNPWVRKIPWRRTWQPTRVFLPGESHEQRSLVGYSPWGRKRVKGDRVTEQAHKDQRGIYLRTLKRLGSPDSVPLEHLPRPSWSKSSWRQSFCL